MSAGNTVSTRPVVVVTRAADRSSVLAALLDAAGFDSLEVPVVAVEEPADQGTALRAALARIEQYDWVVVTSPNGSARVGPALAAVAEGRRPRVAAVGPGTAAALSVTVQLVPTTNSAHGLVGAFGRGPGRVLVAQAEAAAPTVVDGLRALGWEVDAVVAYRTVPVPAPAEAVEGVHRADAIAFTSGSTVRNFVSAVGMQRMPATVVCIGPSTTAVAVDLGIGVTATADPHTLDGLVDALRQILLVPIRPKPGLR